MIPGQTFDYKKDGIVFVQNGTIFYSPNCSRLIKVPPTSIGDPFNHRKLDISMFKQPVWWSSFWGWQSFIPLSPSFTSAPFEVFCWMPQVAVHDIFTKTASGEQTLERRYQMSDVDVLNWKHHEDLITNTAHIIQLQFKISSNKPPLPSSFHYDKPHKSFNVAKKMITLSRNWFIIWMGFLSYIISQTKLRTPNSLAVPTPSPLPMWYEYLRDTHNYSEAWLDGLSSSSACSFNLKTPRAGIIFQWSHRDDTRPSIEFFLQHHIPTYFLWTNTEEQAILIDKSLNHLRPPTDLVQEALTILFTTPTVPLAGLVIQQYYGLGDKNITKETLQFMQLECATSSVFEYVATKFINQTTSLEKVSNKTTSHLKSLAASREKDIQTEVDAAVVFPFQGMIDHEEHTGKLYDHFDLFFTARAKRQAEIIKVESSIDRQRRESREKNPGLQNATLYTWEKTRSSGGRELYMRVRVPKKSNEEVYSGYRPSQRCFNAFSNEWDLCHEFQFGTDKGYDSDSDIDEPLNHLEDVSRIEVEHNDGFLQQTIPTCLSSPQDYTTDESAPSFTPREILNTAKLVYGFVSPYDNVTPIPTKIKWRALLTYLGFLPITCDKSVSENDKRALTLFFDNLTKGSKIPDHLSDLLNGTLSAPSNLFDFSIIRRPTENLFVFYSPRSATCRWVLGVQSAAAALFVCRYILTNPMAHTLVTVAHRLVESGIPFRTLLPLDCSPRQNCVSQVFSPTSHRLALHTFTIADFEASMLQCQMVLSSPQGRAALLRGGIIARIAKEFISTDRVFEGPSIEVTAHRLGYIVPSEENIRLCDDELTEHEIAIICGTYSLYTGTQTTSINFI